MSSLYINFNVEYNDIEQALIHETWFNLNSFQEKINKYTNKCIFKRTDNKITQYIILKNVDDANLLLEWLQEDEQKEFIIELINEIKNEDHIIYSAQNLLIEKNINNKININVPSEKTIHRLNKYVNKIINFINSDKKRPISIPENIK